MDRSNSRTPQSLFDQKLDRAVLVAYFLGAIVPLLVLGVVAMRYALPSLDSLPYERAALLSIVLAVGMLTMASYLAIRRLSRSALQRMDDDNSRLNALVEASRALGGAPHPQAVAEATVQCAIALTGASAAFVVRRSSADKDMSLYESCGSDAAELYGEHEEHFDELVEEALHNCTWAISQGGGATPAASIAVPIVQDKGSESVLVICRTESGASFPSEQADAIATLAGLTSGALQTADLQDVQRNFFAHVTDLLVEVMDAFVDDRAGHAEKVARIVNQLGREMGLEDEHLRQLHFSALLHDIGMLRVDRKGHNDPKQFMKHPRLGHRMVSRIRLWESAAPSILHHHEWYDGSGYPDGLSGDAIPLEARIIAVADAFDAMVRPAGEGRGFTVEAALAEVRSGAGTQFDPEVVMAFARLVDSGQLSATS